MATYKSPGVYVEEISKLPASVAQVETAIPAFIGYTLKNPVTERPLTVSSIREYEEIFGGPESEIYKVSIEDAKVDDKVSRSISVDAKTFTTGNKHSRYKMYYSLQMFFQNGGGKCYIISIGNYKNGVSKDDFLKTGLPVLEKEDEPTLIIFPDATSAGSYYEIVQQALKQAADLGDRFVIMDVLDNDDETFREDIGTGNLKYGAAYYPYLQTSLTYAYSEQEVEIDYKVNGVAVTTVTNLSELKANYSSLYNEIRLRLEDEKVILPPSGAIAGIYARVDRERGVWKAPANESINSVIAPVLKISNADQDDLNIDTEGGKSINAIRMFSGKGVLVWGARTLAGNDNEWRYVSVRRFYNMVEESVRKSTSWAVFEANDANTWIRVKSMIRNYLLTLWKGGALAGGTPDQAFFVKVGLGESMTAFDILEGRMNIEIGMATVRPAEFIILKFSHKLQE